MMQQAASIIRPPGVPQLNRAHPIAKECVQALIPTECGEEHGSVGADLVYDAINRYFLPRTSSTWPVHPSITKFGVGVGLGWSGAADQEATFNDARVILWPWVSILWVGVKYAATGDARISGHAYGNLEIVNSGADLQLEVRGGGYWTAAGVLDAEAGQPLIISCSRLITDTSGSTDNQHLYVNGKKAVLSAFTGNNYPSTGGGTSFNTAKGWFCLGLAFNRELMPVEHLELARDPWAMFRAAPEIIAVTVGGGPPPPARRIILV